VRRDDFRLHRAQCGIIIEVVPGPARGSVATLLVGPDHTEQQVVQAKREARREFDLVMLQIKRVG
jgi:hypothetical protein